MHQQTHIEVKNLNVSYGDVKALHNITLAIPDKKITAIIGPSGCGKTTLLKSFNRLLDLEEGVKIKGEIFVDKENIFTPGLEPTHIRKKMGLLAQKPCPLPMSIFDNVAFGPRIHGLKNKRRLYGIVRYHLKQAGLWKEVKDRLYEPASKLSIGQQQRLCLARGLAVKPEIILGDEPTSALDPASSKRIEEIFKMLKSRYTIVLVTHILRQAKRLADYIVFLYNGELVEHGPADVVLAHPQQPLTQEYINGVVS
ncbi:MAG: phosphate ABC transporter ATP-binding protein [Spirochaetales bacterium]|nr:phosphate ABC transporter ATP-binding protein [Spirochaetales bacterium]